MYKQLGQDITELPVSTLPSNTSLAPQAPLDALPITALPIYTPPMITVGNPALDIVPYNQIPAFLPSTYSTPAKAAVAQAAAAPVASSGSYVSTAPVMAAPSLSTQFSSWLAVGNNKLILLGIGGVVLVASLAKKRRR